MIFFFVEIFYLILAIKELVGKNSKILIRRLIKYELKPEKHENRIFVSCF